MNELSNVRKIYEELTENLSESSLEFKIVQLKEQLEDANAKIEDLTSDKNALEDSLHVFKKETMNMVNKNENKTNLNQSTVDFVIRKITGSKVELSGNEDFIEERVNELFKCEEIVNSLQSVISRELKSNVTIENLCKKIKEILKEWIVFKEAGIYNSNNFSVYKKNSILSSPFVESKCESRFSSADINFISKINQLEEKLAMLSITEKKERDELISKIRSLVIALIDSLSNSGALSFIAQQLAEKLQMSKVEQNQFLEKCNEKAVQIALSA